MTLLTSSADFGLTTTLDFPWYLFIQSLLKADRSSALAESSSVDSREDDEDSRDLKSVICCVVNLVNLFDRSGTVEACLLSKAGLVEAAMTRGSRACREKDRLTTCRGGVSVRRLWR